MRAEATTSARQQLPMLCVGESLIDVVTGPGGTSEHVGGSLLNAACGLARLDHRCTLQTWFAGDDRGARLRERLRTAGVLLGPGSEGAERTSVAHAELDARGHAEYTFELDWQLPQTPDPADFTHLHTGSFACTRQPGADRVLELLRRAREQLSISYDPNVRPAVMGDPDLVRGRIEEIVGLSDVVKASDEDIEWLYGAVDLAALVARWLELGPSVVVITRGSRGALAGLAGSPDLLAVEQLDVALADAVGAGDSFMAGLLSGLGDAGLLGARGTAGSLASAGREQVRPALQRAAATAAITVGHPGAYSPDRDEVDALLAEQSGCG